LKNSCFAKTAKFGEAVSAQQIGDRHLYDFLSQSFSREFSVKEFFNSHKILPQFYQEQWITMGAFVRRQRFSLLLSAADG